MTQEEAMMENGSQRQEKIKTPFAKMIVGGKREKPCFSILYFDPADKDFHIGYSSYYLDYVLNWLNEEFEIVEDGNFALTALRPVSRERVEKAFPGCDYCKHAWMEGLGLKPCASGNIGVELTIGRVSEDDAFGILAYYRNAAAGYIDFPFCPFCGRPMTEDATQMVMERLEALNGDL